MSSSKNKSVWLLLALLASLVFSATSDAQVSVKGYYRKDGTYVQPHYRTSPDGIFQNNWSTNGNVNPYTGRIGTKVSPPLSYGQDVKVREYFRKDGSHVRTHFRSAPDGNFSNNWSSAGNFNPYTGKAGSLTTRPTANPHLVSDEENRIAKAQELASLGYIVKWQDHSLSLLSEMENRIRKANEISELGYSVLWHERSSEELSDIATRIRSANELKSLGHDVDWKNLSSFQLKILVFKARRRASE